MRMDEALNFEGLNKFLTGIVGDLLYVWLPGGKLVGNEYCCGSLRGEPGDSLKVNITTGRWADFATEDKGGDLISLYASVKNIKQGEAYKELAEEHGYEQSSIVVAVAETPESEIAQPPTEVDMSKSVDMFTHRQHGAPSGVWLYRDTLGHPLYCVARYETPKGKLILPWTWNKRGFWNCKGWPPPRPLFGLEYLRKYPDLPVLIVEGEKAVLAARELAGHSYVVVTWSNGCKAVTKTDWEPIYTRRILIWPDADGPGMEAAHEIAAMLAKQCPEIKIIEVTR